MVWGRAREALLRVLPGIFRFGDVDLLIFSGELDGSQTPSMDRLH
ncbi:MAG: hypothetical protein QXM16_01600 [Nitrososphaerota archaeon]